MTDRPGSSREPARLGRLFRRHRSRRAFAKGIEELKMLVKAAAATEEEELGCDEAYEALDQFAEMFVRGEDPSPLMPLVRRHLDMCGNCREEFEGLLRILRSS